jgi:TRAP-type mannitol/chloroaromatic compound transport system permease small subunit
VTEESAAESAARRAPPPLSTPLTIAITLVPALLIIISTLLPWAETAVRVISPVELPALGVPAGPNGRKLSFAPAGYHVGAGQMALTLGLLGVVLSVLRRGRSMMLLGLLATCHSSIALFVLVARNGAAYLVSFEKSLAADPISAQASLTTSDFQPEIGVLLYLAASYLLLLSSSVEGTGLPLHSRLVAAIDRLNGWIGIGIAWLALLMVLVGAYNAIARKLDRVSGLGLSSNAYIEAQWYMFSLIFLLGAAWTLREDGHVRVDVLYGRLSDIGKARIDLTGTLLFLLPFCIGALWFSLPSVISSWQVHEVSPDPGGLPRYPLKLALPIALVMLALQGHAMAVRQVDTLRGRQR